MLNRVIDFEVIEKFGQLWDRPIIVYGTSSKAEKLFPLIYNSAIDVVAYCDGDEKKEGSFFHGNKVERLADVALRVDISSSIILICSSFVDEIICDCIKLVENVYGFLTGFGFQYAILLNRFNLKGEFREWYLLKYDIWYSLQKQLYKNNMRAKYISTIMKFWSENNVLVYQAGKVGSRGISNALSTIHIPNLHIHYLNPYFNDFSKEESKLYLAFLKRIISEKNKIKIITLVRDPVARDISGVFQSFSDPSRWMYRNMNSDFEKSMIAIIKECFADMYYKFDKGDYEAETNAYVKGDIGFMFNWYNVEMKSIFGIDIYGIPFDREKGYTIIEQDNIECLVMKLEKLDANEKIVAQFVGNNNLKINHDHSGDKKEYRFLYEEFRRKVKIPSDIIDFYYNSVYMKHFYTDIEIDDFRKKWKDN